MSLHLVGLLLAWRCLVSLCRGAFPRHMLRPVPCAADPLAPARPRLVWQDDLADVQHRLAARGGQPPAQALPPLPPPVAKGNMVDVFGNVVPPIALDQVRLAV